MELKTLQTVQKNTFNVEYMREQSYKELYEHLFQKYKDEKIHNSNMICEKDKRLFLYRKKLRQY